MFHWYKPSTRRPHSQGRKLGEARGWGVDVNLYARLSTIAEGTPPERFATYSGVMGGVCIHRPRCSSPLQLLVPALSVVNPVRHLVHAGCVDQKQHPTIAGDGHSKRAVQRRARWVFLNTQLYKTHTWMAGDVCNDQYRYHATNNIYVPCACFPSSLGAFMHVLNLAIRHKKPQKGM